MGRVLDTTADPGAPLWWRAEPLRSLVLGETAATGAATDRRVPGAPVDRKAAGTDQEVPQAPADQAVPQAPADPDATAETVRGTAPRTRTRPLPSPPPPTSGKSVARGELTRRGLLLAGGGGLASLLTYAFLRSGGKDSGSDKGAAPDPLTVRRGSNRPGAVRWTLTPADTGATVDALRPAGNSLLVHGVGALDTSDISGGRG